MDSRHNEPVFFHISQGVDRPGGTRVDVRRWALAALVLALLGLAGWLYLEQATVAASYGASVRQLQDEKERLRREITALRAEVAVAGSLTRLNALAEKMGYTLPEATDSGRRLVVQYEAPSEETPVDEREASGQGALPEEGLDVGGRVKGWVSQLGEWLGAPTESQGRR